MNASISLETPLFNEILQQLIRQGIKEQPYSKTLPKDVYCKQYNVSVDTIRKRIQLGIWQYGNQVLKVDGAGDFVDLEAIDIWVRNEGQSCLRE
ncbi:excisionase [Pseudoalteromonas phage KB12-38]|nr:excisionase [Pseudoalteromonas phage KB12-38]